MKKTIYFSLETDDTWNTYTEAWESGQDFSEGEYCSECECITTNECDCEENK